MLTYIKYESFPCPSRPPDRNSLHSEVPTAADGNGSGRSSSAVAAAAVRCRSCQDFFIKKNLGDERSLTQLRKERVLIDEGHPRRNSSIKGKSKKGNSNSDSDNSRPNSPLPAMLVNGRVVDSGMRGGNNDSGGGGSGGAGTECCPTTPRVGRSHLSPSAGGGGRKMSEFESQPQIRGEHFRKKREKSTIILGESFLSRLDT